MSKEPTSRNATVQMTRAEQETMTEAARLTTQIKSALAVVAQPTIGDENELLAVADRLERAARDLAVAFRELARERRNQVNQKS
ncbi:MAG: hypothetical protein MSG64_09280 [Pyrinomonadaceae bacterium MAG19_C2-C3]|nr:hypothetical protein [Pyrinomonadaceae bacterium MAG19_C2-C3]